METPLITTIIPTYKRPQLLKRAITSAASQTFGNLQVCVYDNASGDETADVVAEFMRRDSRVKYHCHSENIGGGANFIFGLEHVDTPYFSLLSDDDLLLPGFYQLAMESLEPHPKAAFFAGSVICMTDGGVIRYVPMANWTRSGLFNPREGFVNTLGAGYLVWTGIIFRTNVFRQIGGLDLTCVAAADIEVVARMASRFPFIVSKTPCAICVSHPGSGSKLPNLRHIWPGWGRMMRKISDEFEVSADAKREALQRLSHDLSTIVSSVGFQATLARHNYESRRACVILRINGHSTRAGMLAFLNKAGSKSAVILAVLRFAARLRRKLQSVLGFRRIILNRKYGKFAKYLRT